MNWSRRTILRGVLMAMLASTGAQATGVAREAGAALADSGAAAPGASPGYVFPSARAQWRDWAVSALGPPAIAGDLVGASWRQWASEEPGEWDADAVGFARRFGTGSFSTFTSATWLSLGSAVLRQDAGYYRSPRAGLMPRAGHALAMTFVARDRDGSKVFSPGKTFAPFVGAVLTVTTLYPDGYSVGDGLVSGAYGLLINAGWNAAREWIVKSPPWRSDAEPVR